ncbi:hypothetical protein AWM75_03730 [Aerococcus urinaehominis]|uniref:RQC P-site tRNA stabilizing factor n=1 Tax=Aerococcus urinaehominis TaxID=128944 RepID=A0A0X8FKU4_9LACT|nr:RNA-binding S4 domain-containing protein [Aerococcus urinaehominis]AMB99168.1 hypothetical protein AWM75_03730 [Aerococcus urinaehominis]SDM06059.1 Ribosomal 50S subunit-recycling heat shock protein, contains S4 domain [Aerococcus urinaehominis]
MRLDKFLKVSRLIKRRSVAKEVADSGRIKVNDRPAKSATKVATGDQIEIEYGQKIVTVKINEIKETTRKDEAEDMFTIISEKSK